MKTGATNMTADGESTTEMTVCVSRLIKAPRQRVFDSWVKPELRRKWWLTESGDEVLKRCEIDARVGGRYFQSQIGNCEESDAGDNYEWTMEGEFLEFVEPERLVFTWNVNHPDEPPTDERVTIEFTEVEGGTEVTIIHRGILKSHLRDGTEKGWTTALETQANVLQRE